MREGRDSDGTLPPGCVIIKEKIVKKNNNNMG